jgi:hypothetical protein
MEKGPGGPALRYGLSGMIAATLLIGVDALLHAQTRAFSYTR